MMKATVQKRSVKNPEPSVGMTPAQKNPPVKDNVTKVETNSTAWSHSRDAAGSTGAGT